MKPLGQKPKHYNFTDCHCKKDNLQNWWEDICDENKTASRREGKKDIEDQLEGALCY